MALKICMVGCGWFANHQYGAALKQLIATHPDWELAACCDIVEEKARTFAAAYGAKRYFTDMQSMFAAVRPDAVLLAVQTSVMFEAAQKVLEQGLPLLLEKPPGLTIGQWSRLEVLAASRGVPNQVAFNRRHMPAVTNARAVLEARFPVPSINRISYTMLRYGRLNEDFSTTAIHALDTLLFLAASPFREAQLSFGPTERGQPVRIMMDAVTLSGVRTHLDILPDAGRSVEVISIDAAGQTLELRLAATPEADLQGEVDYWIGGVRHAMYSDVNTPVFQRSGVYNEIVAFCEAIAHGRGQLTPTLAECGQQVALMEAIRARCTDAITWEAPLRSAGESGIGAMR